MTLRTWAFAIHFTNSSTPVAHALICPDIKYISVRWQDGRRDRREVPASLWPALEGELARDLSRGPVSRSSMISTVLVGSMGGAPKNPVWVYNLRTNPAVEIRDHTAVQAMRAREVHDDAERVRLWDLAVAAYPPYAEYRTRTTRRIPVFVAEPVR